VAPITPKLAMDVTFFNVFFLFMFTPMIKYKWQKTRPLPNGKDLSLERRLN
jgi:hypothetical protein